MELEKNILNEVTWTQKDKRGLYVLTHKWILDVKQKITRLQSHILTRRTLRGTHRSPWEGEIDEISWGNWLQVV